MNKKTPLTYGQQYYAKNRAALIINTQLYRLNDPLAHKIRSDLYSMLKPKEVKVKNKRAFKTWYAKNKEVHRFYTDLKRYEDKPIEYLERGRQGGHYESK